MKSNGKVLGLMALMLSAAPLGAVTIAPPTGSAIIEDLDIVNDQYNSQTLLIYDNPPGQTVVNIFSEDAQGIQLYLYDTSIANLYQGERFGIRLTDSSSLYVDAAIGEIDSVYADGDSVATIYGGEIYYGFWLHDNATVYLHGGRPHIVSESVRIFADGNSRFHLYGTELATAYDDHGYWRVTGLFKDQTPFELRFVSDDLSSLVLHTIPEPASVLLMAAGWAFLRRKS